MSDEEAKQAQEQKFQLMSKSQSMRPLIDKVNADFLKAKPFDLSKALFVPIPVGRKGNPNGK